MRFRELLATDGVEEVCELRSRFGVMAFHGGNLERMTDEIASVAAERAGASLYAVIQTFPMREHLPSIEVSPDASDRLAEFVDHVDVVITIHGYGRHGFWTTLLLGGRHRPFADHVAGHLRTHLPDYTIETDIEAMPKELRGLHATNPVNLPRQRGVQIELPPRVRGASPIWKDWKGPGLVPHTDSLIDGLVAAAKSWPVRGD